MADIAPLTFTDEQLAEAVKHSPPEVQQVVSVVAMQIELAERRALDEEDE